MLYLHQVGSVKVGDVVRYTISYAPSIDAPHGLDRLHLRIRNTTPVALRAAIFPGPYLLSVCAFPAVFDAFRKLEDPASHGIPHFEPQLKAGSALECDLLVPPDLHGTPLDDAGQPRTVSWVVEVVSQTVFTKSASVDYDLTLSSNSHFLESTLSNLYSVSRLGPGMLKDHQSYMRARDEPSPLSSSGIFSKALTLKVEDSVLLWNSPPFVSRGDARQAGSPPLQVDGSPRPQLPLRQKKVHLVVVTHGLLCNLTADMLFLKETIDAAAKANQSRGGAGDEEVIVRGYSENATRTQRGVKFLGKRIAKFVLGMTYPDQPILPTGKTAQDGFPLGTAGGHSARHRCRHTYAPEDYQDRDRKSYKITSISFVGHSLGGPVQTFAIAYIQKHCPQFFSLIKPRNYIAIASPHLGIGAESAPYVRMALESGLLGITGRDLGMSWGLNKAVRSGWGSFRSSRGQAPKKPATGEADNQPLLRLLPVGPAHEALKKFENRTVYANTVNDGIVPLRTSSLLFLDWQSLEKVDRARRDAGWLESIAVRAWREMTGTHSVPASQRQWRPAEENGQGYPSRRASATQVPQPSDVDTMTPAPSAPAKHVSRKHRSMLVRGQTFSLQGPSSSAMASQESADSQHHGPFKKEIQAPPETSFFEWLGDLLNSVAPAMEHIVDPDKRPKVILHDRVYHPSDIPPHQDKARMRVEEKMARAYHCDMSWRKVLVKLEPDAHIGSVVRRRFPDSEGWPIMKHLVDAHFGRVPAAAPEEEHGPERGNGDLGLLDEDAGARERQESLWLDDGDEASDDGSSLRNAARAVRRSLIRST